MDFRSYIKEKQYQISRRIRIAQFLFVYMHTSFRKVVVHVIIIDQSNETAR